MTLGMDWIQVLGTTGSYDSLFHLKAQAIATALTDGPHEFAFLHVKAVDDTGHDRLWQMRVRYIEIVDQMMGQLVARLWRAQQEQVRHRSLLYVATSPLVYLSKTVFARALARVLEFDWPCRETPTCQ